MVKLTDKERAKAKVNFLLANHVEDLDDAYDLVASVKSQSDVDEAETLIEMLEDYHQYLKDEVEAVCDES